MSAASFKQSIQTRDDFKIGEEQTLCPDYCFESEEIERERGLSMS